MTTTTPKPDVCIECPLYQAPMVRGEGKLREPEALGLVFMGEAPAHEEVRLKRPFVGETGRKVFEPLLTQTLHIKREGVYVCNALSCQLDKEAVSTAQVKAAVACCNKRRNFEQELVGAKFIVGMGGVAGQALCGLDTVGAYRGALMESPYGPCLITYHPTYILRGKKDERTRVQSDVFLQVLMQDFQKAYRMVDKHVSEDERVFRPACEEAPDMDKVLGFLAWIREQKALCSVDVETTSIDPLSAVLTIIGFGAFVDGVVTVHSVPVWDGCGYSQDDLDAFFAAFAEVMADADVPKVFHNFPYDTTVLERYQMPVFGCIEDTLIAHHCTYPELMHDLQFVACSYLNVGPWKKSFHDRQRERAKQYEVFRRWQEKLNLSERVLAQFSTEYALLTGKKLTAAWTAAGGSETDLEIYKKARTNCKSATKKVAELAESTDKMLGEAGMDELRYNAFDVACTLGAWPYLVKDLDDPDIDLRELYETDVAVAEVARQMQLRGLPVLDEARAQAKRSLGEKLKNHHDQVVELAKAVITTARAEHPQWFTADFMTASRLVLDEYRLQERGAVVDDSGFPVELDRMAIQEALSGEDGEAMLAVLKDFARVPEAVYDAAEVRTHHGKACVELDRILQTEGFSIMKPDHKAALLDAYNVPVSAVTAKTHQRSMTKNALVPHKTEFAVVRELLDYSASHKLLSTFVEGKKIIIGPDGRLHPSWNSKGTTNPTEYGTVTGRWSSEPNVQNWPYEMRAMIGFDEDDPWTLIGADYSQLEFRILAWFAGETDLVRAFNEGPILYLDPAKPGHAELLAAWKQEKKDLKSCPPGLDIDGLPRREFRNLIPVDYRELWDRRILRIEVDSDDRPYIGRDIHSNTAVTLFGQGYTNAPLRKYKLLRDLTKRATYGGMYGGSADTLYAALYKDFPDTDKSQCEKFLETFDRLWPNIVAWRRVSHDHAARAQILRTPKPPLLGRCRLFPLGQPEMTVAYNFPIQAAAADIVNMSLRRVYDYVQDSEYRGLAFPIIQVHDAIYWEVHVDVATRFRKVLEERMGCNLEYNTVWMSFPVEAKVGKRWSET